MPTRDNVTTLVNEQTRTLVIEWHDKGKLVARTFPESVSIDYARVVLERYERDNPECGPYDLVEYVETTTKTREVL